MILSIRSYMNYRPLMLRLSLTLLGIGIFLSSCEPDPGPAPIIPTEDVNDFFKELPSWEAFAENPAEQAATPTGAAPTEVNQTLNVPKIDEEGNIDTLYDVAYSCEETPYSLSSAPEQIVMYSPDVSVLWAGALIEGKSHKSPIGSLKGLTIEQRDSITITIPGLNTGETVSRKVKPSLGTVSDAISDMIGNATRSGLATSSTISFEMNSYHSEKQMALEMGLSGKYLGFRASASGSFEQNLSETTVTVQFFQKMFTVAVQAPQTPGSFFSSAFTQEKLQEQIDLGKMGPDNLPVYVSEIVYGRMMMFSLTSTASEQEIRTMLQAGYNNIGSNVTLNMSAKQKKILSESKISITSLGGDGKATLDMIRTGDWKDYFTDQAPLSSAEPLSYTFRNLSDGSIAKIVETDEFTITECSEKITSPGVFDYLPLATYEVSDIGLPLETFTGDFNNDGMADLLYNHKAGNTNQVKIGYGTSAGGFDFQAAQTSAIEPLFSWQNFTTHIADLNGDDYPDLVWSRLANESNRSYIAINQKDGTFDFKPLSLIDANGWKPYKTLVGDFDNDGRDEVVWNRLTSTTTNAMWVAELNDTGDKLVRVKLSEFGSTWGPYKASVGNVDGGGDDLLFVNIQNDIVGLYVGLAKGGNAFGRSAYSRTSGGYGGYQMLSLQATNDANTDLIFTIRKNKHNRLYVWTSKGDGTFTHHKNQDHNTTENWANFGLDVGDVDGDGVDDLVWSTNATGETVNRVYTALGTGMSDGKYDFSPAMQTHPFQDTWSQFQTFLMDVNGDRHKDMVWVRPGLNTEVYVGLAK